MKFRRYFNSLVFVACTCLFGCNCSTSNEILILLPGEVKGKPIILAETSASHIFIIDLVPTYISRVWWNEDIVITENNLVRERNIGQNDTIISVERSKYCWYMIHPQTDVVLRFDDMNSLKRKISEYGIDPHTVSLMKLHVAQKKREKELGFKFTTTSVYSHINQKKRSPEKIW